jgi:DNA replication protein DnaC
MTTLAQAEERSRKRAARLILEAELPETLRVTKRPFPEQATLWAKGMKFVDTWAKQGGSSGLLIQGSVGRGKSELLSLLLFMLADLHGKSALWINAREIGLELRASYERIGEGRSEWQILELAKSRDVIAIDDIGSEGGPGSAEHVKDLCKALIDLAASTPKLIVMTGNLGDESLSKLLHDPREASRRAPWERLVFTDDGVPDYRRRK